MLGNAYKKACISSTNMRKNQSLVNKEMQIKPKQDIFFLYQKGRDKKFQSAQYWTHSIASEKEKKELQPVWKIIWQYVERAFQISKLRQVIRKSGNLSKKIILNIERVLWTKVLIIVLFRIRGKEKQSAWQ